MIRVLEGESSLPGECIAIGRTSIRELPAALPKGWPVEVTFEYAVNGRLSVQGLVPGTHQKAVLQLDRETGLSGEGMARWRTAVAAGGGFQDFDSAVQDMLVTDPPLSAPSGDWEPGPGSGRQRPPSAVAATPSGLGRPQTSPAVPPLPATPSGIGRTKVPTMALPPGISRPAASPTAAPSGIGRSRPATPAAPSGIGRAGGVPIVSAPTPMTVSAPTPLSAAPASPAESMPPPAAPTVLTLDAAALVQRQPAAAPAVRPRRVPSWLWRGLGHVIAGALGLVAAVVLLHYLRPDLVPSPLHWLHR